MKRTVPLLRYDEAIHPVGWFNCDDDALCFLLPQLLSKRFVQSLQHLSWRVDDRLRSWVQFDVVFARVAAKTREYVFVFVLERLRLDCWLGCLDCVYLLDSITS